jgi:hypothetical protein
MPGKGALTALALTLFVSSHAAAEPTQQRLAPLAEVGGGSVGLVAGIALLFGVGITVCNREIGVGYKACDYAILPLTIAVATVPLPALGVVEAGKAVDRGGSVPGAYIGAASGSAVAAGAYFLTRALEKKDSDADILVGSIAWAVLPIAGSVIGYDVFRNKDQGAAGATASGLVRTRAPWTRVPVLSFSF